MENVTIEINGVFKSIKPKTSRGETLLNHFFDGVIDAEELLFDIYSDILETKDLAEIIK